ncbi:MAG: SPOR domain-containing protein [Acidobacteria bacterium]|nr:SPOR domain-containing protein [Acidobacteriota bacterium]MCA1609604.1 SPOR domain-containing protein [Acidobacteriota bacterium]
MDEPRTHYQLSFTARQALLLFVGLLAALAAAYVFGLMTGLAGRDGSVAPVAARSATPAAPALVPTVDALEVPRAVRGLSPPRGRAATPDRGERSQAATPLSVAAGPTPSPGLQLFDDGPGGTPLPSAAAPKKAHTPARSSRPETTIAGPPAAAGNRPAGAGAFWVQALSAPSEKEARGRRDRLASHGFPSVVSPGEGPKGKVYRVRVGPYATKEEAEKTAARLKTREKLQPWIVPPGK